MRDKYYVLLYYQHHHRTYPLTVSVHGAAEATSVSVVVTVVVTSVVSSVHPRVVHVHHILVHGVPVVHAVHGHRTHGAQGGPPQEASRHPETQSLARVSFTVAAGPGKVCPPVGPVARSSVAVGLPSIRVDASHGGAGVARVLPGSVWVRLVSIGTRSLGVYKAPTSNIGPATSNIGPAASN